MGAQYRVIVTGSRDYEDIGTIARALSDFALNHPRLVVVHGDCATGADRLADNWVRVLWSYGYDIALEPWPADWSTGRGAGPRRNRAMVQAGADLVLAFFAPPPAGNIGTQGCVDLAEKAGIEVISYGREV